MYFPSGCRHNPAIAGTPDELKDTSNAPVDSSRARLLRLPPSVNVPPIVTFPLDSTRMPLIDVLVKDGAKEASRAPLVSRRASPGRGVPLTLEKVPPITIFPSDWRATASIAAVPPIVRLNVPSSEPSVLSLTSGGTGALL